MLKGMLRENVDQASRYGDGSWLAVAKVNVNPNAEVHFTSFETSYYFLGKITRSLIEEQATKNFGTLSASQPVSLVVMYINAAFRPTVLIISDIGDNTSNQKRPRNARDANAKVQTDLLWKFRQCSTSSHLISISKPDAYRPRTYSSLNAMTGYLPLPSRLKLSLLHQR